MCTAAGIVQREVVHDSDRSHGCIWVKQELWWILAVHVHLCSYRDLAISMHVAVKASGLSQDAVDAHLPEASHKCAHSDGGQSYGLGWCLA